MTRLVVCLLAVLLMGQAPAPTTPSKTLTVGFSEFLPFKYKEAGRPAGIDVRILESIAKTMGLDLAFVDCPLKRCLLLLQRGEVDVVTSLLKTPEREVFAQFIEPAYLRTSSKVFYVKKGSGKAIKSYDDLAALKIGVKASVSYFPRFDNDVSIRKEAADDVLSNFRKLAAGRIDAVIDSELEGDFLIKRHDFGGQFAKQPFRFDDDNPVYMALSRKSPHVARSAEMAAALAALLSTKAIDSIVKDVAPAI